MHTHTHFYEKRPGIFVPACTSSLYDWLVENGPATTPEIQRALGDRTTWPYQRLMSLWRSGAIDRTPMCEFSPVLWWVTHG